MNDRVIKLENVTKYYKLYESPKDRLKEALHPFRKRYYKDFCAIRDISFELKRGECLGVIGKNGMGKSTLLKLIAHIIEPSVGSIQVNGTVSALLELGTGFNPEFTGRENIFFYGTILGFKKNEIESRVNEIIKFADIGEFIDQPVKTYSGGMFVRLAFAVQTSLKPDILLVDEVLSVGDIFFQQKCHGRIEELMSQGTALVLVSHDMQTIEKYSSKTILLNYGKCITIGLPNQVVNEYYQIDKNKLNVRNLNLNQGINRSQISSSNPTPIMKWPDNENFIIPSHAKNISSAICTGIALCNSEDEICTNFKVGDTAYIFYEIKLLRDIEYPYGMVTIINSKNIVIHAKDTLQYFDNNSSNIPYKNGDILKFMQSFCLSIAEGDYTISLGFGHIKHDDINAVKSSDYSKRNLYMESLLGIVNIIKFSVKADNGQIGFPFHGYVDLKGTFLQFD